ncbi:Bug family tripartite tricarboxylate transporter substrate binding protein [Bradyrhizobium sp. URHC0002]
MRRLSFAVASCLALLACKAADVQAQIASESPLGERPLALVVPFAAGGGTDILARLIGDRLRALTGKTIVIDNKPGANGLIASQFVEKSMPDGHTLMFGSNSTHVIAPLLSTDRNAMDEVRRKFVLISIIARTPLVLAVNENSRFRDLNQFLAQLNAELTFGTFGVHSSPHLMGALLATQRGLRLVHVPYKGSAPAVTDLIGGTIDSVFLTVAAVSSYVEAKQLRALAVTGTQRVSLLPDVPTFQEAGVGGLENDGWFAVFAPAGTPGNIVVYLRSKLAEVMAEPGMQAKLQELGLQDAGVMSGRETDSWDKSVTLTQDILRKTRIDMDGR